MTQPLSQRNMTVATALGLAGLLPFFACAAAANLEWAHRETAFLALLAYGACILSFLGAVHWGFVLSVAAPSERAASLRLVLGTAPSLIAWLALILGFTGYPSAGLAVLLAGLLATVLIEAHWTQHLLLPLAYFRLRVVLSTLVALTLAAVLIGRFLGKGI